MSTGLADIRSAFLDFFGDREHEVVASSPLVPLNDPTLLSPPLFHSSMKRAMTHYVLILFYLSRTILTDCFY